jgi:lipopolysaccharide transport system ATP-binding protein
VTAPPIVFDKVCKNYPLYHHFTGGIKNFIINMPAALKALRKTRFEALQDLSFEVRAGETLGIIGGNGAGKSTILGLVAGVLKASCGVISVTGRVSPLLELGAGFHRDLTGRENIILNGILLGLTRTEVMAKINAIIEFSELGEFIDQPVRIYSNGMLARLGFSVVAQLEPEILVIDEVLAVGDEEFQKKCINKMKEFKKKGVTMLFVSHSMSSVEMICDRVLWIENKTIRMSGVPREVVLKYAGSAPLI